MCIFHQTNKNLLGEQAIYLIRITANITYKRERDISNMINTNESTLEPVIDRGGVFRSVDLKQAVSAESTIECVEK